MFIGDIVFQLCQILVGSIKCLTGSFHCFLVLVFQMLQPGDMVGEGLYFIQLGTDILQIQFILLKQLFQYFFGIVGDAWNRAPTTFLFCFRSGSIMNFPRLFCCQTAACYHIFIGFDFCPVTV